MSEKFSLKDHLFNKESLEYLAGLFYTADKKFPKKKFLTNIMADFPVLELKQRITRISDELANYLPSDFPAATKIIVNILPAPLNPAKTDNDFGDFIFAPLSGYIQKNGCEEKYLDISFSTLKEITKRFSVEFAIRDFINDFPQQTFMFLKSCAKDDNYHVRRLASEGLRPRLPWAVGISFDYKKSIKILDVLFSDLTRYVTRSVANHMNDISKIDADLVLKTLALWKSSKKQNPTEMEYIMAHSLRTLVKDGNKKALHFLQYKNPKGIIIKNFNIHNNIVTIGESLIFEGEIFSQNSQKIIVDYVISYPHPNNKQSKKTFSLKKTTIKKNTTIDFIKKHRFKLMTTKNLYAGKYNINLRINGTSVQEFSFTLVI